MVRSPQGFGPLERRLGLEDASEVLLSNTRDASQSARIEERTERSVGEEVSQPQHESSQAGDCRHDQVPNGERPQFGCADHRSDPG